MRKICLSNQPFLPLLLFSTLLLFQYSLLHAQTSRYVKPVATGTGDGSSWANASGDLQAIINASSSSPGDSIFVAVGTYKPNRRADNLGIITVNDRYNAFVLKDNVKIYGGFDPDNGISDLTHERIFGLTGTILSGDFNDNDVVTGIGATLSITGDSENAYHVVISSGPVGDAIFDGFTITGGSANAGSITANGNALLNTHGGGMYLHTSSPTLSNLTVIGNKASNDAGGIYLSVSSPVMNKILVTKNYSTSGAGIYHAAGSSSTINSMVIYGNHATGNGGGIFNSGSSEPKFINCLVVGNQSVTTIRNNSSSHPFFFNCTIAYNPGNSTATISNNGSYSTLRNCILYGNSAVISGNESTVSYSLIQGGYAGAGNISGNPLFVNPSSPAGPDGIWGTDDDGLSTSPCSPAVNSGNNGDLPIGTHTDIAGNSRISISTVDMGAYEVLAENFTRYVREGGSGDGSSWANASGNLQAMIDAPCVKEVRVAAGTYYPTHIQSGTERDTAFLIKGKGIRLLGGYPAMGGNTRDPEANPVILSGNIGNPSLFTDDSYHVMVICGLPTNADSVIVDGFTLTSGNSNGVSLANLRGINLWQRDAGGLLLGENALASDKIHIKNCKFIGNRGDHGGGITVTSSGGTFINCLIAGNTATYGSGMFNWTSASIYPTFINCTFAGNNSIYHTIYNSMGSPRFRNCIIYGNQSGVYVSSAYISNSIIQDWFSGGTGNSSADPKFLNPLPYTSAPTTGGNYQIGYCSAAVNAGNSSALPPGIASDLSGNPRIYQSLVDIGAYEMQTEPDTTISTVNACASYTWINGITYTSNNNTEIHTLTDIAGCDSVIKLNLTISPGIRYVKAGASGNGTSWADAMGDLQEAINQAATDDVCSIDTIFVAVGTYKPNRKANALDMITPNDRDNAFVLKPNVKIFGGFDPDNGIDDLSDARIFGDAGTVLSGDFDDNDVVTGSGSSLSITNNSENAYHVMVSVGNVAEAALNGLTIRGGNANNNSELTVNGYALSRRSGGGLSIHSSSPSIEYCTFIGNNCSYQGGGIYTYSSSSNFSNSTISRNKADSEGGGINFQTSSPTLRNSTVSGNYSSNGGGVFNYNSTTQFLKVTISSNRATTAGGGLFTRNAPIVVDSCTFSGNRANSQGGAVLNRHNSTITNTTFSGNRADNGGGIHNNDGGSPTISFCTFTGNTGDTHGGGMYTNSGSPKISRCIFSGGTVGARGGGIYVTGGSPVITSCVFSGNSAGGSGGGMRTSGGTVRITNCTFAGNNVTSAGYGAAIYKDAGVTVIVSNSIIWGNLSALSIRSDGAPEPIVRYSIVEGGYPGTGNINTDPMLMDVPLYATAPFNTGDYRPKICSPAINAGRNDSIPSGNTTDIAGNPRIFYETVDMGAYELQENKPTPTVKTQLPLCRNGNAEIIVPASVPGITYRLRNGVTTIGSPQNGNGDTLTFRTANLTGTANYNVQAEYPTCTAQANLPITVDALPSGLASHNDSRTCYLNGNNTFVEFRSDGGAIMAINPGTQNLGYVTVTEYLETNAPVINACGSNIADYASAALRRHWTIVSENSPSAPVSIRTYFDMSDVSNLDTISAITSNPNDDITDISQLELHKYSGPNENGSFGDNCFTGGTTTVHSPTGINTMPNIGYVSVPSGRYMQFSIPGFSELWLAGSGLVTALPVSLTSFTGECENASIKLDWTTESEINNELFLMERSTDLMTWETIATVQGAGNSNEALTYSMFDNRPYNGTNYYRLTQYDYDGKHEIFAPISVGCHDTERNPYMIAYPNPTQGEFSLEIRSKESGPATVQVVEMSGKVVYSLRIQMQEGNNILPVNKQELTTGSYMIRLTDTEQVWKPIILMVQ